MSAFVILGLHKRRDEKVQQGSRKGDWDEMSWCFHAVSLVWAHAGLTLSGILAEDIQLLQAASTVTVDSGERDVSVHDLGIGNLQSVKLPPLQSTHLPAMIFFFFFLGQEYTLLRPSVNALLIHWPSWVSFERLVQISGILTPSKIYVCGRLDRGQRFNGNSLRKKLIFVAFYYIAGSSNGEGHRRQSIWCIVHGIACFLSE